MLEIGQQIEVNVCLGERSYGIYNRAFERVCQERIGNIESIFSDGHVRVRFKNSSASWNLPPYVIKKIKEV